MTTLMQTYRHRHKSVSAWLTNEEYARALKIAKSLNTPLGALVTRAVKELVNVESAPTAPEQETP